MNEILHRLKRERVWAVVVFLAAAAFIALVQAIATPEARPQDSSTTPVASVPAA